MSEKRDKTIQLRVTEAEKAAIEAKAKSVSLSSSDLIRSAVLSDKSIVLLPEGAEIAKTIVQLHLTYREAMKRDKINDKYALVILQGIEKLTELFGDLTARLTPLIDEEAEQ